jgi:hypothetical protein
VMYAFKLQYAMFTTLLPSFTSKMMPVRFSSITRELRLLHYL